MVEANTMETNDFPPTPTESPLNQHVSYVRVPRNTCLNPALSLTLAENIEIERSTRRHVRQRRGGANAPVTHGARPNKTNKAGAVGSYKNIARPFFFFLSSSLAPSIAKPSLSAHPLSFPFPLILFHLENFTMLSSLLVLSLAAVVPLAQATVFVRVFSHLSRPRLHLLPR